MGRWRLPKIEGGEGLGHEKGATAEKQLRPVCVTARRSRCQIVPLCATGAARKIRQAVTRAPFTLGGVGENPNEKHKTNVFRTHASTEVLLVNRQKPRGVNATARWLWPPGQSLKVTHLVGKPVEQPRERPSKIQNPGTRKPEVQAKRK